jgi:nucleotide-binding universal stress UspA family protein
MTAPRKILVPTDFSETSEHALAYARVIAQSLDATFHLLHVILDANWQPWSMDTSGVDVRQLMGTWEAQAQERLTKLRPDETTVVVTKVGHPFLEIIRYAKAHDIDLIVMGTHGRGAIEHMLLGSVAEKVVRKAPCPVLTVRHPEHRFQRP